MKKILCPTDFSETSHTAIAYAAKLAKALNAELTLLNVQSVFDYSPLEVLRGKDMHINGIAERLEAQSREVSKAFRISCYSTVVPGHTSLSSVIRDRGKSFDLIVMGSDGPDDVYQFFSGSNTYNALVKSETPLLLIPAGYAYSEIRHIVYAYDYYHEKRIPIEGLTPLARQLKADITILQVLSEEYGNDIDNDLRGEQTKIANLYGDEAILKFDTLRSDDVSRGINSHVLRNEPDLLALSTVHRNFLARLFHKSVVKNLTAFCSYPVFVFHG